MPDPERRVLWQRLDTPGMDACRFIGLAEGGGPSRGQDDGNDGQSNWQIDGSASLLIDGEPALLRYRVACHRDGTTRSAQVDGWVGSRPIALALQRSVPVAGVPAQWRLNDQHLTGQWLGPLELDDVDLGFTPATNTCVLRRLRFPVGQEVETTALWLDTADWTFKPLRQIYRRIDDHRFDYASPVHDFRGPLQVDGVGVVVRYADLWREVAAAPDARL